MGSGSIGAMADSVRRTEHHAEESGGAQRPRRSDWSRRGLTRLWERVICGRSQVSYACRTRPSRTQRARHSRDFRVAAPCNALTRDFVVSDEAGFEPTDPCGLHDFQSHQDRPRVASGRVVGIDEMIPGDDQSVETSSVVTASSLSRSAASFSIEASEK
jgi:hypothetical protein